MATRAQQALAKILQDDWDGAHYMIQHDADTAACHIHAYLHRVEGDLANAHYWYAQVGLSMPSNSLDEELQHLLSRYYAE